MKKIFEYIFCIILLQTSFTACNDLNLNPLSEGSSETWNSNEVEMKMSVNRLFSINAWIDECMINGYFNDTYTDNFMQRASLFTITNATINSQTGFVKSVWYTAYKMIAAANLILTNLSSREGTMSEANLARYEANARFVRASMYARLIFFYGDIPYYTTNLEIEEFNTLSRTDKGEVLKHIYEDYDYATEHLPMSYGSSEDQYATKGAALAMKARIALYMGDYITARDAALACMNLNQYFLYPNYEELFWPETKNSVETIFCQPRSLEQNIVLNTTRVKEAVPRILGGYNNGGPSLGLFYCYLCTDGLPVDESPLFDPHQPFKNRDPRLAMSIAEFGTNYLGIIYQPHPDSLTTLNVTTGTWVSNKENRTVDQWASFDCLIRKKGMNRDAINNGGFKIDPDNIVLRYADVLLIYAEAKIELNEIDQTVFDVMNMVRARAYGVDKSQTNQYPAITETDQAKLRKILRTERRMEFAWEGTRYQDIIRWKTAEILLNKPLYGTLDPSLLKSKIVDQGEWFLPEAPDIDENGDPDFTKLYNDGYLKLLVERKFDASKQYLWPIPSEEITVNSNITQNSGY